jgi:hypothetical protein
MLVFLAVVFATLMLGLAFTAGRVALPPLSPAPLAAAVVCAAAAIALGIVGLVKSYAGDPSFLDSSGVWLPYAEIWAIVATAVMVASRPLHPAFARVLAIPFAVAAIAFGIVGAAIGLGDDDTAVSRGLGWMGFGAMSANLAVAAWFGARPTGASVTGAGP